MAKKKKNEVKAPIDFGDFLLVNHEKHDRAVNGVIGPGGQMVGGVGEDASPEEILAEYDRLGGLVLKKNGGIAYDEDEDGNEIEKKVDIKVATGSFYDFKLKKPRTSAEVKIARNPNRKGVAYVTTEEVGDKGGDIGSENDRPGKDKRKKVHSPADEKDFKDEE